jgi:hypothetical protein
MQVPGDVQNRSSSQIVPSVTGVQRHDPPMHSSTVQRLKSLHSTAVVHNRTSPPSDASASSPSVPSGVSSWSPAPSPISTPASASEPEWPPPQADAIGSSQVVAIQPVQCRTHCFLIAHPPSLPREPPRPRRELLDILRVRASPRNRPNGL